MKLRKITAADLPALKELFCRSVYEIAGHDYTEAQCDAWTAGVINPQWAERFLNTWTLGAVIDNQLAGFANLETPEKLDCFYVHPAYQRLGVGTKLMEALVQQAVRLKAKILTADVSLTARPFFERQGWKALHDNEIRRGEVILINTTMQIDLSAYQEISACQTQI